MAKYIYQEKGIEVDGKRLVHPKFAHIRKLNSKEFVAHASHGRRDKEIALTGDSRLKVSSTTPEQRLRLLQEYLEQEGHITVSQYARLTGISPASASREHRKLYESIPPL